MSSPKPGSTQAPIRIGARRSPLARVQADQVAARLAQLGRPSEYVPIITHGDTDRRELVQIGGTGVFVGAVRDALSAGEIDVAVHSLKDLPTEPAAGLRVAAVLEREDTRDVLVGLGLDDLRDGSRIGTGAPRRSMQLCELGRRRGLQLDVRPVRGNVGTRLQHVLDGRLDAIVLAAAGLRRLGHLQRERSSAEVATEQPPLSGLPAVLLGYDLMLPAAGQGAIACEVADTLDADLMASVAELDHRPTRVEVVAERTFLRVLEAGCTAPVGARAVVGPAGLPGDGAGAVVKSVRDTSADLTLTAVIGKNIDDTSSKPTDGIPTTRRDPAWPGTAPELSTTEVIRIEGFGLSSEAEDVGRRLAREALSR